MPSLSPQVPFPVRYRGIDLVDGAGGGRICGRREILESIQVSQSEDTTRIQMLQDELKRVKVDVQAYSTTLTSLQQTLRAMERTVQELRGVQSLAPTRSHQKQANYHVGMQHSVDPSTDMDHCVQKQQVSPPEHHTINSFNLTGLSTKPSTKSRATTCFEVALGPDAPVCLYKGTCTSYLCRSYFSPSDSS